jgi:hypothetical protein
MLFDFQNSSPSRGGYVPMKFKVWFWFLWTLISIIYFINSYTVGRKYFICMLLVFANECKFRSHALRRLHVCVSTVTGSAVTVLALMLQGTVWRSAEPDMGLISRVSGANLAGNDAVLSVYVCCVLCCSCILFLEGFFVLPLLGCISSLYPSRFTSFYYRILCSVWGWKEGSLLVEHQVITCHILLVGRAL